MPQPIGYNFAPTGDNAEQGRGQRADQAQRAIQTLSFQLPKFAGASRKLSPLQGQQMAGSPISQAVLQSVLRTIFGADATMGSFADPHASSDPAGVYGPAPREFSPGMLPPGGGRTPDPTIHIGDGGRDNSGLGIMSSGFGEGPVAPPFFDRTTPGGSAAPPSPAPGPYSSWAPDERALGSYNQIGHLMPDFQGGTGYY
jgi:hypothetical protein